MNLTVDVYEQTKVVRIDDPRLDAAVAAAFKDELRYIADEATQAVVLDMSNVTFIDSSGIGAIVAVVKHLGRDRRLAICSLAPMVLKLFKLTRMDSVFEICGTLEEALDGAAQRRRAG